MSGFGGPFGPSPFLFLLPALSSGVIFLVLVLAVVYLVRPRESDPHGRRPYAVYLFTIIFASLLTLLVALGAMGVALAQAVTDTGGFGGAESCEVSAGGFTLPARARLGAVPPGFESQVEPAPEVQFEPAQPEGQFEPECTSSSGPAGATAAHAGIIGVAAAAVLWFHATRARELLKREASDV